MKEQIQTPFQRGLLAHHGFQALQKITPVPMYVLLRWNHWIQHVLLSNSIQHQDPILLIGAPRTGTTFLHRFLHEQGIGRGPQLWEIMFPARFSHWLIRPWLPLLQKISPTRHHPSHIHKTSLTAIEVEEAGLLFHFCDGFLLYSFVLAHADDDLQWVMDPKLGSRTKEQIQWLRRIWSQYPQNPLSKIFSWAADIPVVREELPNAKMIYTYRDPLESIPSTLSLLQAVLHQKFEFQKCSQELQHRYYRRIVMGLIDLYRRFWMEYQKDDTGIYIMNQYRLKRDFSTTMYALLDWLDVPISNTLKEQIELQHQKNQSFVSQHQYQIQNFGMSSEELRELVASIPIDHSKI